MQETFPDHIIPITMPTPFSVGPVNAFLVRGEPLALVDAGIRTDAAWESLLRCFAGHGLALSDLDIILLTHSHFDHVGLLGRILENSHAEVYAHPRVARLADRFEETEAEAAAYLEKLLAELGTPPESMAACLAEHEGFKPYIEKASVGNAMQDGDTVAGFTAHHAPGHSASDVVYVNQAARVAFTGDHLLKHIHPNPLIRRPEPGKPRSKSLLEYQESLRRTHTLDIDWCCPGHGEPFSDYRQLIDCLLVRQERKMMRIYKTLESGPRTPYEVAMALFPKLDPAKLYFALSVAVGFLEVLEERGKAVSEHRESVLHYGTKQL